MATLRQRSQRFKRNKALARWRRRTRVIDFAKLCEHLGIKSAFDVPGLMDESVERAVQDILEYEDALWLAKAQEVIQA